jgi:hypothetical protein
MSKEEVFALATREIDRYRELQLADVQRETEAARRAAAASGGLGGSRLAVSIVQIGVNAVEARVRACWKRCSSLLGPGSIPSLPIRPRISVRSAVPAGIDCARERWLQGADGGGVRIRVAANYARGRGED